MELFFIDQLFTADYAKIKFLWRLQIFMTMTKSVLIKLLWLISTF